MLKILILTAVGFFISIFSFGQQWADMLHEGRANFYEIQSTFEEQWSQNKDVRGSGWKPYKRWEYDTEERVYPDGIFPPRHLKYTEFNKFMSVKCRSPHTAARSHGNWQELGPKAWVNQTGWNPGIGRVNFIYEEPENPETIYVGTPAGGLWRSTDDGMSWTPLTDQLPSMGVSGIAIDPNDTDIIYIATGDRDANDYNGVGVLKSTDYGQTWQTTGMAWNISDGIKSNWLIMHPEDAQTLYLASNDGLFKTEDGTMSWQKILNGNIREVALHPGNPEIVYAVSNRFFRSENGGLTFEVITDNFPTSSETNRMSLAVTPAAPNMVYVIAGKDSDSGFRGLYRSNDSGLTFTERSDSPNILGYSDDGSSSGGQSWFDLALAASPSNPNRIFTGGINVWRSINGGLGFNSVSHWVYPSGIGYTHADIHFLRFYGNRLYCGSDGGIFRSTDNGQSWTDLSSGLGITQLYRMDFSEQDPYQILVGTQDNGTNFLYDSTFFHLLGGDGNGAAVNNDNPDILYGAYPYGEITRSIDGGNSFENISWNIEENGLWVTPYVLDPSDQNVLFAGYQSFWKYTPEADWQVIGEFGGNSFRTIAVAPTDNNYLYGAKNATLYRTTDGGQNWDVISNQLPNLNITEIAVNPTNPEHILVTCSGYSAGNKVFESFDAGSTFENISYNLPNIPANCVVMDNSPNKGIYVGTDAGIFYTNDELANWIDFMEDLPKTSIRQLKISESIGKIRAGTFGRGIWESDLYTPSDTPPVAAFTSNVTTVCIGDSVQFTDLSYNAAPGWNWSINGGTPAISTDRNPVIYFYEEGIFDVSLTVQNQNGTDSTTITQYVVVFGDGITAPIEESFEEVSALDDIYWSIYNPDNDITWAVNEGVGFASNQSVWINNFDNTTGRIDQLKSPSINLDSTASAVLTFKMAYAQRSPLNNDRLRLYISSNCGDTWSLRGQWIGNNTLATAEMTEAPFVPQSEDDWQMITISNITSNYLGPNFMFRFDFLNESGNNIYLDDININVTWVGMDENELNLTEVELFPNPARGQTTLQFSLIENTALEVQLLDATGRVIRQIDSGRKLPGQHRETILTHDLAAGAYLVRVIANGKSISRKLFIE